MPLLFMFFFISLDDSRPDGNQSPLKISQPVSGADKSDVHASPSYMNINYNNGFRTDNEDVLLSSDLNWNRCIKHQSNLANNFFAVYSKASLLNCRLSAWRVQKLFREQQQFFLGYIWLLQSLGECKRLISYFGGFWATVLQTRNMFHLY